MGGADAKHITLAGAAQVSLDVADTIDRIAGYPSEWNRGGNGTHNHPGCELRLGRKRHDARHVCGLQTRRIIGPAFRQIERPINEGMAVTRYIGGEYADLTVRDLTGRTRVLPRHAA